METLNREHELVMLRDIARHPEDEGLRLIFADWLEENGQGHFAEFIRLQLQYRKQQNPEYRRTGERKAYTLWADYGRKWWKHDMGDVNKAPQPLMIYLDTEGGYDKKNYSPSVTVSGGFPEEVYANNSWLALCAKAVFDVFPIKKVYLSGFVPYRVGFGPAGCMVQRESDAGGYRWGDGASSLRPCIWDLLTGYTRKDERGCYYRLFEEAVEAGNRAALYYGRSTRCD
jgi:uncharacterized protein (TIGR02996 family)